MEHDELVQKLQKIEIELDFLRARNDVLTIALKYVTLNSPQAEQLLSIITKRLTDTADRALFSTTPTDEYLHAFDAAAKRVGGWLPAQSGAAS